MRIQPRQNRSAGRAATASIIELGEPEPVGGKLVEIGRRDLAAVATDVGEAHIIHEEDNDVGSRRRGGGGVRWLQEGGSGDEHDRSPGHTSNGTPGGRMAGMKSFHIVSIL